MFWRATTILTAGWAIALSAQTAPPEPAVLPQPPAIRPETERALREFMKKYSQEKTTVCSIPLLEVPVAKTVRMPTLLPPAGPDRIDRMPSVKLPAPPCKEEKR